MSLYDLELTELDGSNVMSSIALSQKLGREHARVCAVIKGQYDRVSETEGLVLSNYFIKCEFESAAREYKQGYLIKKNGLVLVLSSFMTPELATLISSYEHWGALSRYTAKDMDNPHFLYLLKSTNGAYYNIGVSPDVEAALESTEFPGQLILLKKWEYESQYSANVIKRYVFGEFREFATDAGWFYFPDAEGVFLEKVTNFINQIG